MISEGSHDTEDCIYAENLKKKSINLIISIFKYIKAKNSYLKMQ